MSTPAGRALPARRGGDAMRLQAPEALHARGLAAARRGLGRTSPNPAVGAVVVRDGRIVGRGHHARAGGPHAEVVALRAAGERGPRRRPLHHPRALRSLRADPALLAGHPRRPGIRRVLVGSRRSQPAGERARHGRGCAARGRGGGARRAARRSATRLNAPWFTLHHPGRPHVTLKAAVTLDGKHRHARRGCPLGERARRRAPGFTGCANEVDAVLVGAGTARADDPAPHRPAARRARPGPAPGGARHPPAAPGPPAALPASAPRRPPWWPTPRPEPPRRRGPAASSCLRCRRGTGGVDLHDLLASLAARGVTHAPGGGRGRRARAVPRRRGWWTRWRCSWPRRSSAATASRCSRGRGPARMADALRLEDVRVRAARATTSSCRARAAPSPRPVGEDPGVGARIRAPCSPASSPTSAWWSGSRRGREAPASPSAPGAHGRSTTSPWARAWPARALASRWWSGARGSSSFEAVPETLARTTLGGWRPGTRVNLERALRLGRPARRPPGPGARGRGRRGARGACAEGQGARLTVSLPAGARAAGRGEGLDRRGRRLPHRGGARRRDRFEVALIPDTLARTTLGDAAPGTRVNLEADVVARHVARLRAFAGASPASRGRSLQRWGYGGEALRERARRAARRSSGWSRRWRRSGAGKMIILIDDEDRENEGDLCMAAEKVTPAAINFMATHGRGLICLAADRGEGAVAATCR